MNTASESIISIPLSRLVAWEGNVRKTGATDGLEELTANIAAHGILQSLVVKESGGGKFAVIAGRRRYLALSELAKDGAITPDAAVPCRIVSPSASATELSLSENVVRAPMHPADQFEAFRELIDGGSTPADIAARFGISEAAVKRLKLARVSPAIFTAYRDGDLTLEQVQAFTISEDHAAQECVFNQIGQWSDDPDDIRRALTQDDIPATDKRARFVTVAAYEEAGGTVRRDLFAEDDDGVFLLDPALLDRLAQEKLEAAAGEVRGEGWKWVEVHPEFDYAARAQFRRLYPEPLPLGEEDAAERSRLAQEYEAIYSALEEDDEEACARLDEIEARVSELEDRESVFTCDTLSVAGAIVTLARDGTAEIVRGLVRDDDAPRQGSDPDAEEKPERPEFSAPLVLSLTAQKSAAISATLVSRPDIALAAVAHALASDIFPCGPRASSLEISTKLTRLREECRAKEFMEQEHARWCGLIPGESDARWQWCLSQNRETLLDLLAYCAACAVNAVQGKHEGVSACRREHAQALATALNLDMTAWFTPTANNFFSRVSRAAILSAMAEAKGTPAKRSWEKLRKSELAALAEREVAGTGWLPRPLQA